MAAGPDLDLASNDPLVGLPDLPSWHVAAFYRPPRTVGGDFYDFIPLPDGRVMFVVGDVTDKGIPAALVMASAHALLRDAAPRLIMTSMCEATTRALPGAAVIELCGEVDGSAAAVLTDAYAQAIAADSGAATVVLDFAAVDYLNSTGIALIVGVLARARAERRKVVASGLSPITARFSTSPGWRRRPTG